MSEPSPETRLRLRRGYRLQWEPAQAAHVLLYPEGMVRLNESAAAILAACDGRELGAITAELADRYDAPGLAADIREFVATALARGWLSRE
ncbi:MAG: pyrroloquinoline quinone biosynthesis peptide chaperone PqqD [Pseudomonadota bacterium]|nr:pyrroloquinoline quinone biosynthesis peptide chaperone PqqD [Pseudomonadota bacterium]HJO35638.1 pyrroloquinoline quinone biosynthesis peptide chaperone PqqD [Gammaproteobacteria bacterium]